jgi:N-methylhydantoinase A
MMIENFHREYKERWGNRFEGIPVQGVTYRVEAVIPAAKVNYPELQPREAGTRLTPSRSVEIIYLGDTPCTALEYDRDDLRAGDVIDGPAIVRESLSTTFMLPGQRLTVGTYGELRIRRSASPTTEGTK